MRGMKAKRIGKEACAETEEMSATDNSNDELEELGWRCLVPIVVTNLKRSYFRLWKKLALPISELYWWVGSRTR